MDRRRFAKLIAAAVVGVRVVDEVAAGPLLLEDARTNEWDRSPEFDNAKWDSVPGSSMSGGYFVSDDFADALRADGTINLEADKFKVGLYHA